MRIPTLLLLLLGPATLPATARADCEEEASRFARSLGANGATLVGSESGLNRFHFTIPGRGLCSTEFKRHSGTYVIRGACSVYLNWANETKFGSNGAMYNQGYRCPQPPRARRR